LKREEKGQPPARGGTKRKGKARPLSFWNTKSSGENDILKKRKDLRMCRLSPRKKGRERAVCGRSLWMKAKTEGGHPYRPEGKGRGPTGEMTQQRSYGTGSLWKVRHDLRSHSSHVVWGGGEAKGKKGGNSPSLPEGERNTPGGRQKEENGEEGSYNCTREIVEEEGGGTEAGREIPVVVYATLPKKGRGPGATGGPEWVK